MRPFSEGTDSRADFFVQPIGKDLGTGSDANVKVRITDATGTVVHASAEQVHHGDGRDLDNPPLDVSVLLTPGQTYYLFVENDGGTGANSSSFYFIHHYVGTYWYGFAEEEGPTNTGHNDSLASSEYSQSFDGLPNVYFYDGNLPGGTDVDWFYLESSGSNNDHPVPCATRGLGFAKLQGRAFSRERRLDRRQRDGNGNQRFFRARRRAGWCLFPEAVGRLARERHRRGPLQVCGAVRDALGERR